ncbi:hypothetical protein LRP30_21685 [Bradyrhizobium sp. C-145]|uniref:hypothetical protein n=1 Tax=Bradyrhizobium sp. C-145 TaxID=574727 RepID=UPI00201B4967|nr:hypothetical protein [Bradyrhizobium sp. C-145]UQR67702.1 hypothetical protein LRP30_21685 [Bradyrhizobium sp. C-145]
MSSIIDFQSAADRAAAHAKAFVHMEGDVCDLERMAHIALAQIQDCSVPDDDHGCRELELAVFAVAQLTIMAKAFRKNYEAAYRGQEWPE